MILYIDGLDWIGLDWLSYNDTIEYDRLKKGNFSRIMLQSFGMVDEGKYVWMDGWIVEERKAIV